jgi:hypothetical protein
VYWESDAAEPGTWTNFVVQGIQSDRMSADISFTFAFLRAQGPAQRDCRGEAPVSRSRKPSCHRHPSAGSLAIAEDQAGGRLGLASYTEGGCDCCEPWSAEELVAILRDLQSVAGLQAQEPLAG